MTQNAHRAYVLLKIMGQRFGVPEDQLRAFGRAGNLSLSDQGEGRVNLKGKDVTVIDPARCLGRPNPDAKAGDHVAIVEVAEGPLGILVEACERTSSPAVSFPIPAPFADWSEGVVSGMMSLDGDLLPILDCDLLRSVRLQPKAIPIPTPGPTAPIPALGSSASNSRVVLFPVGRNSNLPHFGLSLIQVPEVRDTATVAWIPGSPSWVRGITRWQNQLSASLDLGELCGFGRTIAERWMVVQGFKQNERFVVPVGRDVRILPALNAREDVALPTEAEPWMHGAYALSETPFWLIDFDRISGAWQGA